MGTRYCCKYPKLGSRTRSSAAQRAPLAKSSETWKRQKRGWFLSSVRNRPFHLRLGSVYLPCVRANSPSTVMEKPWGKRSLLHQDSTCRSLPYEYDVTC